MPPAALISILQKGLQYVEAEISINEVCSFLRMWQSSRTPPHPLPSRSLESVWFYYIGLPCILRYLGKRWRLQTGHCTISKIWVPPCVGLQNHKVLTNENSQFILLSTLAQCMHGQANSLSDFPGHTGQRELLLNTHEESVFCLKLTGDITKGKFDQHFFLTLYPFLLFLHFLAVTILL